MATVRELKTIFTAEAKGIKTAFKQVQQEAQKVSKANKQATDDVNKQFDGVEQSIEGTDQKLGGLRTSAGKSMDGLDSATKGAKGDLQKVEKSADSLDSELKTLGNDNGLKDVEEDANGVADALSKLGGSGGAVAMAGGAFVAASAGLLGFVAAGAGIFGIVKSADALKGATNGLQTQTGATKEEMEGMRDSLLDIYGNNFGEGFDDIADSMANVKQQTNLSGEELEMMTQNALLLRDAFDYDVAESTKAATILMKQFGIEGEQAQALIAEGTQKGLNYADDLLDTIGEYSVYYEQAGFSAEEMFGMFKNAQETGAFNLDYAA